MNGSLAFTWSPDPKKFKGIKPRYQWDDILSFVRLLSSCAYFTLYPELNANGNLHIHARVEIFDKVKWYKKVLPTFKYNGFVLIKSKDINEKWDEYIAKDKEIMESVLELKLPIVHSKASPLKDINIKIKKPRTLEHPPSSEVKVDSD